MYFDPLTAWIVALIGNGISASSGHISSSKMNEHYKEWEKWANDSMNACILKIRDRGYFSAERALQDVKIQVEIVQNKYDVKTGKMKLRISHESFDFIVKLCKECKEENLEAAERYRKIYQEQLSKGKSKEEINNIRETITMHENKANSFQSILAQAERGRENVIQEEKERAQKIANSDSDGVIILKSILVIALCIIGFVIAAASESELIGGVALIGAAIGGYYIFKPKK